MKKIAISADIHKYREEIRHVMSVLSENGCEPIFPYLDYSKDKEDLTQKEKECLTEANFKAIEESDAIYFILNDSHISTGCKIRIGYALALGKHIYFSALTGDRGVDCYVEKVIVTDHIHLLAHAINEEKSGKNIKPRKTGWKNLLKRWFLNH